MPELAVPLTDTEVKNAKGTEKPRKLADGCGMFLLINPDGARYRRMGYRFAGTERLLAFGKYPEVSLAEARAKRTAAREQIKAGIDPAQAKRIEKLNKATEAANTF